MQAAARTVTSNQTFTVTAASGSTFTYADPVTKAAVVDTFSATDVFMVDGVTATEAVFVANLSVGDLVTIWAGVGPGNCVHDAAQPVDRPDSGTATGALSRHTSEPPSTRTDRRKRSPCDTHPAGVGGATKRVPCGWPEQHRTPDQRHVGAFVSPLSSRWS